MDQSNMGQEEQNSQREEKVEKDREKMEDFAYVLDFMPYGHPDDKRPIHRREPLAQVVGEKHFTLLEISLKKNANPFVMDRLYIGKGERDVVHKIKRKLRYENLTPAAKSELPYVLEHMVKQNEMKFIEFFNKSESITTRLHQLELLPGVGKKTMWAILDERKREPFKGFMDLAARVKGLQHPEKFIINRIIYELKNPNSKYKLFTL
jgi:putative nucleotide binding protein